jgi:polysaccharide biosynthesis transport protein
MMHSSDPETSLPAVIPSSLYPDAYGKQSAPHLPPQIGYALLNGSGEEPGETKIPLSEYLWILKRYRWRIAGFCGACVAITLVISARLTPIYESTATVDVDRQTPSAVVGQDAARTVLNDSDQYLATQIKLVQSDSVLRPVDQRFGLREREHQSSAIHSPRGEAASVVLQQLKVTRPPNTYLILISYRDEDPQLAADATNAVAQSYLEHTYNIRLRSSASLSDFMERQLEELRAKVERSAMALAGFERELNVVNPEEKTNILAARLLQLNTEYTNAQAERLKRQAAFESVDQGSVEAALAAVQGEPLRKLAERQNEAREHFADIQAYYGPNHPEYRRAAATLRELQGAFDGTRAAISERVGIELHESERHEEMARLAVAGAKEEYDRVNARSVEYQAVKREAEADRNLYEELVRKIKEAAINAGFQSSAIRIADPARPEWKPVFPNIPLNALLALLFSLLLSASAAILSDLLDKTVRDPEQVARTLRTEVIGSLPLMKNRHGRWLAAPRTGSAEPAEDMSGFGESVRTLRNSILLGSFDCHYRSLLVTSAAPGEGKTTTATHLAVAHAEQGRRTLLIDGDLRRPSVHRNFDIPSVVGLSNALLGETPWRDAVVRIEALGDLDVLPAGPPSRRASDLVGRGLVEILEEAASDYDLVILDAPPLLGFAEPLQMATAVDGVIVVARAGVTGRKAVATVLATLSRLRAKVIGLVLNEVHKELSDSYYYYGYYRSYYRAQEGTRTQEASS